MWLQGTGFAGFQQESQAEAPLYANALIDSAEQERDGAGLQQGLGVLDTPAAVKPQFQRYINKLGCAALHSPRLQREH